MSSTSGDNSRVVSVIAGGWSFSRMRHENVPGTIIAVNEAAVALKVRPHFVVSMDRLWTENRFAQLSSMRIPSWLRRSAVQNIPEPWRHEWLTVFDCDNKSVTFTDDGTVLNGTNSGTCALALAHRMRPEHVLMFGFDMQNGPKGQPHWHAPYSWVTGRTTTNGKFKEWSREFELIEKQFRLIGTQVWNVSDRSLITAHKKLNPQHLGTFLREMAA